MSEKSIQANGKANDGSGGGGGGEEKCEKTDEKFEKNDYGKFEKMKSEESETLLRENLEDLYKDMPLTDETTCGFWILKGSFLQRFPLLL